MSRIDQSVSIGFRSELFGAQSSILHFSLVIFSLTIFDVCHGAKPCSNTIFHCVRIFANNCFTSFCRTSQYNFHSYFRCKSLHWSFESPIYLPQLRLFHHHRYWFVANTPTVAFLFLVARIYIDSFVLRHKTLIHLKKSHFPNHPKSSSCVSYAKQPLSPMLHPQSLFFHLDHIFKAQFFQISTNCSCCHRFWQTGVQI